ncbi:MAG: hypothetical protein R3B06_13295, partial [Kofleriaceae bacterium]
HPERFVRGVPRPAALPTEVWINKPTAAASADRSARRAAPTGASPSTAASREDRTARPPDHDPHAGPAARNHAEAAPLN